MNLIDFRFEQLLYVEDVVVVDLDSFCVCETRSIEDPIDASIPHVLCIVIGNLFGHRLNRAGVRVVHADLISERVVDVDVFQIVDDRVQKG